MSSGLFKNGNGKQKKNKQCQPPRGPYFPPQNYTSPIPQQSSKTHQRWTTKMTQIMISALLEEVARDGKRTENAIKKDSMMAAATAVNNALGMNIDHENVRSKYKTLKKDYSAVKTLLDASGLGFEWDKEKNMVVCAAKSDAFERFLQAHPKSRKVQGKAFPYYDAMNILVGNEITNGGGNNGGEESPIVPGDDEEEEEEVEVIPVDGGLTQGATQVTTGTPNDGESSNRPRRVELPPRANVQLPCKCKKSCFVQDSNYAKGIMEAVQCLAESFSPPETYMDRIRAALKKVAGEDRLLYARGLEYLTTNTKMGDVFLLIDKDMRFDWLVDKLEKANA